MARRIDRVLWANRTTQSLVGKTPFYLVYGAEALILTDAIIVTLRTNNPNMYSLLMRKALDFAEEKGTKHWSGSMRISNALPSVIMQRFTKDSKKVTSCFVRFLEYARTKHEQARTNIGKFIPSYINTKNVGLSAPIFGHGRT